MLARKFYLFITMIFYYLPVYASDIPVRHKAVSHRLTVLGKKESDIGDIATNLFGFALNIGQLFKILLVAAGITVVFVGMAQYKKHRNDPLQISLSTVIMTIVIGLSLIALSLIPMKF